MQTQNKMMSIKMKRIFDNDQFTVLQGLVNLSEERVKLSLYKY